MRPPEDLLKTHREEDLEDVQKTSRRLTEDLLREIDLQKTYKRLRRCIEDLWKTYRSLTEDLHIRLVAVWTCLTRLSAV